MVCVKLIKKLTVSEYDMTQCNLKKSRYTTGNANHLLILLNLAEFLQICNMHKLNYYSMCASLKDVIRALI